VTLLSKYSFYGAEFSWTSQSPYNISVASYPFRSAKVPGTVRCEKPHVFEIQLII